LGVAFWMTIVCKLCELRLICYEGAIIFIYLRRCFSRRGIRGLLMMKAEWRYDELKGRGVQCTQVMPRCILTERDGLEIAAELYLVMEKEILAPD
jgi:hypothetical protein